jgi:hypothetical protein
VHDSTQPAEGSADTDGMATTLPADVIQPRIPVADEPGIAALIDDALAFQLGRAMPALFRAEARLVAAFAKLDVIRARSLYQRLVEPALGDRMALRFARLARAPELLGFLRDARRVNAAR